MCSGAPDAGDVGAHPRGEDAARTHAAGAAAGEAPLRVALGLLLVRDGEDAVVDAGLDEVRARRSPWSRRRCPRCARGSSACRRHRARRPSSSSGIMTPSNGSGALPRTTASMSVHVISASSSARWAASRTSPASDTSSRRFLCFVWPMPTTAHGLRRHVSLPPARRRGSAAGTAPTSRAPRPGACRARRSGGPPRRSG